MFSIEKIKIGKKYPPVIEDEVFLEKKKFGKQIFKNILKILKFLISKILNN